MEIGVKIGYTSVTVISLRNGTPQECMRFPSTSVHLPNSRKHYFGEEADQYVAMNVTEHYRYFSCLRTDLTCLATGTCSPSCSVLLENLFIHIRNQIETFFLSPIVKVVTVVPNIVMAGTSGDARETILLAWKRAGVSDAFLIPDSAAVLLSGAMPSTGFSLADLSYVAVCHAGDNDFEMDIFQVHDKKHVSKLKSAIKPKCMAAIKESLFELCITEFKKNGHLTLEGDSCKSFKKHCHKEMAPLSKGEEDSVHISLPYGSRSVMVTQTMHDSRVLPLLNDIQEFVVNELKNIPAISGAPGIRAFFTGKHKLLWKMFKGRFKESVFADITKGKRCLGAAVACQLDENELLELQQGLLFDIDRVYRMLQGPAVTNQRTVLPYLNDNDRTKSRFTSAFSGRISMGVNESQKTCETTLNLKFSVRRMAGLDFHCVKLCSDSQTFMELVLGKDIVLSSFNQGRPAPTIKMDILAHPNDSQKVRSTMYWRSESLDHHRLVLIEYHNRMTEMYHEERFPVLSGLSTAAKSATFVACTSDKIRDNIDSTTTTENLRPSVIVAVHHESTYTKLIIKQCALVLSTGRIAALDVLSYDCFKWKEDTSDHCSCTVQLPCDAFIRIVFPEQQARSCFLKFLNKKHVE